MFAESVGVLLQVQVLNIVPAVEADRPGRCVGVVEIVAFGGRGDDVADYGYGTP